MDLALRMFLPVAPLAVALSLGACGDDDNGPTGGSQPGAAVINADITSDRTFYAETTYTLSGFVHVANGATLTIEPGTKIVGDQNVVGSSLFILRGAKIIANGTAQAPIVFTSSQPVGSRQPGEWGGLIIVGNGIINRTDPVILEGTGVSAADPAVDYAGGTDNTDNSGELSYVRMEFSGYATAPDAELNSFTFAAVGSGTRLSYLESLAGLDDSYEFFGGAVDGDHLVSYESGDDHYDQSEGYVGRLQYIIGFQSTRLAPRAGAGNFSSDPQGIENDGCNGANCPLGQTSQPFTVPLIANFTLVGTGPGVVDNTAGGVGMMLRRGTGGYYVNGVVARWPLAAISLRDQTTLDQITAGNLVVNNIYFAEDPVIFQPSSAGTVQGSLDLAANNLEVAEASVTATSLFTALPTTPTSAADFDWSLSATAAPATGGLTTFPSAIAAKAGSFVVPTSYRGAADPAGAKWWEGWTSYARN